VRTLIHTKAGALMHSLVRNHPFIDGNKRTAVLAVIVFYNINGYELDIDPGTLLALAVDAAEGHLDVQRIAGELKNWVHEQDRPEDE
jgi:death-on-curing protein